MSLENSLLTPAERRTLRHSVLARQPLEEQFRDFEHQHSAAVFGMWVFLATEVMFFGTLFVSLAVYRWMYGEAFEKASEHLNWIIGGINTLVLLVSSFSVVVAVHYAQHGQRKPLVRCLVLTALLGCLFLVFKGIEYYIDYREKLIPGWRFDPQEWIDRDGLSTAQVAQVQLFLVFYWVMTLFHGLHVTIGIIAVFIMARLAAKSCFSPEYYAPVDVTALYWHFVDIVWIFLLPMLYLLGTHQFGK